MISRLQQDVLDALADGTWRKGSDLPHTGYVLHALLRMGLLEERRYRPDYAAYTPKRWTHEYRLRSPNTDY